MIGINTNPLDLLIQRNLSYATSGVNTALQRMSTGFKVNSAADDAAGLYVATKMNTQIRGLLQAQKNTRDGLSFLQTASSGLNNMTSILQRLRDLSVQASSGFYGDAEREAMQAEAEQLRQQLFQVKNGTNFNGINIFGEPEIPIARTFSLRDSSGKIQTYKAGSFSNPVNTVNQRPSISPPSETPPEPPSIETESPVYDPIDSMTGDEMQLLKTYLDSGGNFDDFSIAFKNNRHLELVSGKTSPLTNAARGASPLVVKDSGNIDFTSGQTQVVTLNGATYTIKNNASMAQQLAYSVEGDVLKIIGSNFSITGQSDKQHNLEIMGKSNTIRTGDLNDRVNLSLAGSLGISNIVYLGAGDDTLTAQDGGCTIYGEEGNDTMTSGSNMHGGLGNDTITVTGTDGSVSAGAGNDIINYNTSGIYNSTGLYGDDGDDVFNIVKGTNVKVNGGAGVNTIKTNVLGANAFSESFAKNETREVLINGLKYTITNGNSGASDLIWQVEGSTVKFLSGAFTIKGEENKAHDVKLSAISITFHGGNLDDKIVAESFGQVIYAGGGNDTISGNGWQRAYGESGNDIISGGGANSMTAYANGGDGDDIITTRDSIIYTLFGGSGNDTFNVNNSREGFIYGEDGDDVFNINLSNKITLFGGAGNNVLQKNNGIGTMYSDMSNVVNNMTAVSFLSENQTKTITINGINYTIKNLKSTEKWNNVDKQIGYSYNAVTDEITFMGVEFEIKGDVNKQHNVRLIGRHLNFYGGDLDDKINNLTDSNIVYAGAGNDYIEHNGAYYCTIYGEGGDDEIVLNSRTDWTVDGGEGDDKITIKGRATDVKGGNGNDHYIIDGSGVTINDAVGSNIFEINGSNNNIAAGSGKDTFYVNGNNNIARGGAGDDYIVINGSNNTIDGGTGNNLVVDKGTGNSSINVIPDPNSGTLFFNAIGQTQTVSLNGRLYTIKNTTTEGTATAVNQLKYNFNNLTGEVEFEGNNFTIENEDGLSHNVIIKGNNNVIKGGDQSDKILVSSGSGNRVLGGDGNDSILINTVNNKVQGGSGDDKIVINASQGNNLIDGEGGNDNITVNAGSSTNIKGGFGNDTIKLNGDGNSADSGDGNDNLTAIGSNNTLQSSLGDNKFGVSGSNNIVIGGLGNESFAIDGDNNSVTTGAGNDTIGVKGDKNNLSSNSGINNFTVNGSQNILQGGSDVDTFEIAGIGNTAKGGDGDDSFFVRGSSKNSNIDGEGGALNTMINRGEDTIFANVKDMTPIEIPIRLQVGAGSDENSFIKFNSSLSFFDFNIDFSSTEDALKAIDDIDGLLNLISKKNSEFGAVMNRLDSVLQSQIIQIENLTASRSSIMDADIAAESADFVKNQILQQTSATLLSSSKNFQSKIIIDLIRG